VSESYPGAEVETLRGIESTIDHIYAGMPDERSLIAGLVLAGLLSDPNYNEEASAAAKKAIAYTDTLLVELKKSRTP
jgi:hypothetical protein